MLLLREIHCQQIMNIRSERENENYNIYYDLSGDGPFEIKVYFSEDGGSTWSQPPGQVTGAVGPGQKAGFNRKIRWDITAEQTSTLGKADFKVEAISALLNSEAGTFTDPRDGKSYKWLKINDNAWMEENLNFNTYPGSWCYENQSSNCASYGRLYVWTTATTACPAGWHLPSDTEWTALADYLGGENECGGKMKETGSSHWKSPNTAATNSSGFNALPAGFRGVNGYFFNSGSNIYFWSSSELNATRAWKRVLYHNNDNMSHLSYGKDYGFSVRCVRD